MATIDDLHAIVDEVRDTTITLTAGAVADLRAAVDELAHLRGVALPALVAERDAANRRALAAEEQAFAGLTADLAAARVEVDRLRAALRLAIGRSPHVWIGDQGQQTCWWCAAPLTERWPSVPDHAADCPVRVAGEG